MRCDRSDGRFNAVQWSIILHVFSATFRQPIKMLINWTGQTCMCISQLMHVMQHKVLPGSKIVQCNFCGWSGWIPKVLLPVLATKYEDCRGLKQNAIAYNCITSFYWKRTTCRTLSKLFRTQLDPLRSQALRTLPSDTTLAVKQCKPEENCAILTEEKHEHASAWIRFTAPLLIPTFAAQ